MKYLLIMMLLMVPLVGASTLHEYPSFYSTKVGIVVGDLALSSDTVGAIEVATGLKEANPGVEVIPLLASEVGTLGNMDLIVIGGPCANSVAAQLMDFPLPCYASIEANSGVVQLYNYDSHEVILVAGSSAADTRRAAKALANDILPSATKLVVSKRVQTEISVS